MKTFYFSFSSGWIGGDGVVVAETKEKALEIVNAKLPLVLMGKQDSISLDDLIEVEANQCIIVNDGNY